MNFPLGVNLYCRTNNPLKATIMNMHRRSLWMPEKISRCGSCTDQSWELLSWFAWFFVLQLLPKSLNLQSRSLPSRFGTQQTAADWFGISRDVTIWLRVINDFSSFRKTTWSKREAERGPSVCRMLKGNGLLMPWRPDNISRPFR